jgi:hypothetical protein
MRVASGSPSSLVYTGHIGDAPACVRCVSVLNLRVYGARRRAPARVSTLRRCEWGRSSAAGAVLLQV